jgi:hypothetical protein
MPRKRRQAELPGASELYDRLFREQGGVCAICGSPPKSRRLHLDHNHRTNRTRGLLCFRCNRALPTYLDSEWLRRACEYVAMDEQAGVPDQWEAIR